MFTSKHSRKQIRKLLRFAPLLLLFTVTPQKAAAAPGDLDTSFDGDGKVTTSISTGLDVGRAAVIQPDGKIVVAGIADINNANSDFIVIRYNPDGSLDTTFDGDGKVTTDFSGRDDQAHGVAIQADGKLVVAGSSSGDFALARYNTDGSLDVTFDVDGRVLLDVGGNDSANAIRLQPNGKIIVVGNGANAAFAVRYNSDGSLDTTFDTDGVAPVSGSEANAVSLQSDGKIVIAGASAAARMSVTRLNTNGSPDTNFGTGGTTIYTVANRFDIANAVAIQPDGRILAAGFSRVTAFGPLCAPLVRFSAAGLFEQAVVNCNESPGGADYRSLLVQPDGKIVVGGFSSLFSNFLIVRYNPNLSLDNTFNGTGTLRIDFQAGMPPKSEGFAVALPPDGKIIAAGVTQPSMTATTGQIAVARILSGLRVSRPTFDFDGDRKADVSVFRPDNSYWYLLRSQAGFTYTQFGISTDKLAPADYDGDGKTDFAVLRENPSDPARANFYLLQSSNGTFESAQFGASGDVPAAGDWDGDGRADLTVYRDGSQTGGQSYFFYRPSSQPATDFITVQWGASGDKPVASDFDGDGRTDAAVFRASTGAWYVLQSSNNQPYSVQFGSNGDKAVPADYDGDGDADIAVFRPSTGRWYTSLNLGVTYGEVQWGQDGDVPVPADYDGDGRADIAVFRAGTWYLLQTTNNFASVQFGLASDRPIPGAYVP
jgi:uncharacterized delta-60 repeat protein